MNRNLIFTAIFTLLVLAANGAVHGQDFKTNVWLEDLTQLKQEMSAHYANLEWAVEARGLDLKQLSEQTESRLRQARNAGEAQKAIESFLNTFGDGHLEVQWRQNTGNNSSSSADDSQSGKQAPLCQRLGYQNQDFTPRIAFSGLSGFREIKNEDSKYLAIGILRFPNNKEIGIIRIALFSEYVFPDLCEQAVAGLGLTKDSPCDDECDDRIERKSADLPTAALTRQIEVLKRNKISALLVDITGNGGGTNWAEPAARSLTPKPLRSPRQQFIKHEHWTKQLHRRLEIIEADLRQPLVSNRIKLLQASSVLRKAILESQKTCRREAIWENQNLNCSLIAVTPTLYPQSILPYAKPGSLPDTPSSHYLFYPSRYNYREGVNAGRLMILVDRGTSSSAEYFTAMLRDNNAAMIIGEPTSGSGCGYTNGGISTILKNTGARVKIPDCVRLRVNGANEVEGITPEVLVPWRANDTRYQRANRVFDVLAKNLSSRSNRLSQ